MSKAYIYNTNKPILIVYYTLDDFNSHENMIKNQIYKSKFNGKKIPK